MKFYPTKLKDTASETVSAPYKWAKRIATLAVLASGFIYYYADHLAGFLTLSIASVIHSALIGREYYIDALFKIRTATDLRLRLLSHGDSEFALETLKKDSIWRGEEPDPEITERLAVIKKNKEEFQGKLDDLLEQFNKALTGDPVAVTNKPDTNEPN